MSSLTEISSLYKNLLEMQLHSKWKQLDTFPSHFHNGSDDMVVPRHIPETPESALREFLNFAIDIIAKK